MAFNTFRVPLLTLSIVLIIVALAFAIAHKSENGAAEARKVSSELATTRAALADFMDRPPRSQEGRFVKSPFGRRFGSNLRPGRVRSDERQFNPDRDAFRRSKNEDSTVETKSVPAVVSADRFSVAMDAAAMQCVENQHVPGLAVVVVKEGKTIFKRGYGVANVEQTKAVDPNQTLFRIGSISKALTLLTLTRLIDDGRIKRNDPVEKYFGPIANPRSFEEPVTIDHLLTHTAGFDQIGVDRHVHQHHLSLDDRKALRTGLSEFLNNKNLRRVTEAGEMYRYDTYGTTLAGAIIEKVTGKPFAAAMKQEMFDVLGMNNTYVEAQNDAYANLATGYGWADDQYLPQPYEVFVTTPASSIDATISDMGRMLEALTSDGANAHGRLFTAKMNEAVMAPQFRTHPEFLGITHGLFESYTSDEAGTDAHLRTVGHGGNMRGFCSAMTIIPDHKIGVFITANRAPEAGGTEVNFMPILKVVVDTISDPPKHMDVLVPKNISIRLDEYVGDYYYGTFCHDLRSDDLAKGAWRRRRAKQVVKTLVGLTIGEIDFLPREKDVFVQQDGQRLLTFGRDSNGLVSHFVYSTSPDTFERESKKFPYPDISSLAQATFEVVSSDGVKKAVEFYRANEDSAYFYVSEVELDRCGYVLLQAGENEAAVQMFTLNAKRFPQSWNVYDSLGEAHAKLGNNQQALFNFEKSIQLNPINDAGIERVEELRAAIRSGEQPDHAFSCIRTPSVQMRIVDSMFQRFYLPVSRDDRLA